MRPSLQYPLVMLWLPLGACGTSVTTEWSPKSPEAKYGPIVEVATRVQAASKACDSDVRKTLGVIHAEGDPSEAIHEVAVEAAARGGTHYVVGGDATDREWQIRWDTIRGNDTRMVWAVVYRCER